MYKPCRAVAIAVLSSAVVVPASAAIYSHAGGRIDHYTLELFDLDPADGITAAIGTPTLMAAYTNGHTVRLPSGDTVEDMDHLAGATGTVSSSGSDAGAAFSALLDLSSTSRLSADATSGPGYAMAFGEAVAAADFTLTAQSRIRLTATFSSVAETDGNAFGAGTNAYAYGAIVLVDLAIGSKTLEPGETFENRSWAHRDGAQSFTRTVTLISEFSNLTNGDLTLRAQTHVFASTEYPTAVPEPQVWALLGLGLAAIGWARCRRAVSASH